MQNNIQINKLELLRYLGYNGQNINILMQEKIDKMTELCLKTIRPKNVYKTFELENMSLKGTNFTLQGESVKSHLKGCDRVILMAATCGFDLDQQIAKMFLTDKTSALILDSAGSVAIESYLDNICSVFENATDRFSSGYGDFPLSANKNISEILNAQRIIGLNVNESFLLSPKKSVTAVIGLGRKIKQQPLCDHKCQICKFEKCLYTKN